MNIIKKIIEYFILAVCVFATGYMISQWGCALRHRFFVEKVEKIEMIEVLLLSGVFWFGLIFRYMYLCLKEVYKQRRRKTMKKCETDQTEAMWEMYKKGELFQV